MYRAMLYRRINKESDLKSFSGINATRYVYI